MGHSSDRNGELHSRLLQQEVVAELGQLALDVEDLDQLFRDSTEAVAETLDTEYCEILELLPPGDELLLREGVGWRDGLVGTATVPTKQGSQAGYTLLTEKPVIVDDPSTDDRVSGSDLLTRHDVLSGISVIIGSIDDPWGYWERIRGSSASSLITTQTSSRVSRISLFPKLKTMKPHSTSNCFALFLTALPNLSK